MQQENEVPTQNVREMLLCLCADLQNKIHMFQEYFLSFTANKITEKVELTKEANGKNATYLCTRYGNCLHAANLYSRTFNPSTKTCVL